MSAGKRTLAEVMAENKMLLKALEKAREETLEQIGVVRALRKTLREDRGWITAEQELPDDGEAVLVAQADGDVWLGFLDGIVWRDVSGARMEDEVTHWMSLPAHPEDAK